MNFGKRISDEEWNLKVADGIKARSKARGDYNRQVAKELQEKKKRESAPAQQEEQQHQEEEREEEEEVKPKKKRASKKSKDSDSDSDYEEKPKKKRASTKKAKAADNSDSDAEEEVKPKKTAAAAKPKGAAKPKEPTPAKVKKPTIKDTIVEIVAKKRKGITCKEMLRELRKRGFSTSDAYVRVTCRDLGIVLEHEAQRKGWFIRTPGMY